MNIILLLALLFCADARAFEKLSEAQSWIYDRNHLSNTSSGQTLSYQYTGTDDDNAITSDKATLSILAEPDAQRRDVEVDFLSDERHIALPAFSGYRGNPIIIAMLEHVAQSMSAQTGGGALYFRNRIRDALAGDEIALIDSKTTYENRELQVKTLRFHPFEKDEYLAAHPVLEKTEFTIQLCDEVPGGLVGITVSAHDGDKVFKRDLSLM